VAKPCLHLDADASRKDLYNALISKGHGIPRTPASGLPSDANNEIQLRCPGEDISLHRVIPLLARALAETDRAIA
jgi:hypothetical protein